MSHRGMVALWVLLVFAPGAASASGGGLLERPALTGDWGGARSWLEERGVTVSVTSTQYYGKVVDGGSTAGHEWEWIGTADYRLKLDTGKAGLWPGGSIELHGESDWGRSVDDRDGTILPSNFDFGLSPPAGEGSYLSHVVITQFLGDRFAVLFGKLDTSTGDTNDYACGRAEAAHAHDDGLRRGRPARLHGLRHPRRGEPDAGDGGALPDGLLREEGPSAVTTASRPSTSWP